MSTSKFQSYLWTPQPRRSVSVPYETEGKLPEFATDAHKVCSLPPILLCDSSSSLLDDTSPALTVPCFSRQIMDSPHVSFAYRYYYFVGCFIKVMLVLWEDTWRRRHNSLISWPQQFSGCSFVPFSGRTGLCCQNTQLYFIYIVNFP